MLACVLYTYCTNTHRLLHMWKISILMIICRVLCLFIVGNHRRWHHLFCMQCAVFIQFFLTYAVRLNSQDIYTSQHWYANMKADGSHENRCRLCCTLTVLMGATSQLSACRATTVNITLQSRYFPRIGKTNAYGNKFQTFFLIWHQNYLMSKPGWLLLSSFLRLILTCPMICGSKLLWYATVDWGGLMVSYGLNKILRGSTSSLDHKHVAHKFLLDFSLIRS